MTDIKMYEPIAKTYRIKLLTGLHIGGSQESLQIGGIDSPVVKNPITGQPYIPGSSIKGKMRALIEMIYYSEALKDSNYGPIQDPRHIVARAFGCAGDKGKIASRLIFEDFKLTDEWEERFKALKSDFFEDKAENSVPRFLKGNAKPRHIERVPAGIEFEGNIILIPVDGEYGITQKELEEILERGIKLLNATYLGGGGSRGSGRIKMEETRGSDSIEMEEKK